MMAKAASVVVKADEGLRRPRYTLVQVFVLCSIASVATSWFYQTPVITAKADQLPVVQHKLQVVVTKDVPKLKQQIGCEHARADTAIASAYGAGPDPDMIGNCPPISTVANLGKVKP